jgi:F420H(2)-dependent quinone reductase
MPPWRSDHVARGGDILRLRMPGDRFNSRLSRAMPAGALRAMGKLNVPVYRLTRGRLMGKISKAPVLLLTTTGRRSGQRRTTPVCYLADGQRYVVIGSNAGNERAPAWSLNLLASPDAELDVYGKRLAVSARVAEGEERAELWRRSNAQYTGFDDYRERTSREIKVFVLEPRT